MNKAQLRRLLGVIILLISLVILLWSLWPLAKEIRSVPVDPEDMMLPTSWILLCLAVI